MLGCRPIEITQIFNVDYTEDHAKKSASRPVDAPGEIQARISRHTALRQRTDEHFRIIMVPEPGEVIAIGHIQALREARPGPVHDETISIDEYDNIGLRNILHALRQIGLDFSRSHQALEILRGLKVQAGGSRSHLPHDQIDNLYIATGLFGENDTHAVRAAQVIVERGLATMPDHQARRRTKRRQDQCAEHRGGLPGSEHNAPTTEPGDHSDACHDASLPRADVKSVATSAITASRAFMRMRLVPQVRSNL